MGPLDALIHVINFLMPAVVVGLVAASLTKLFWRRQLAAVRWVRMATWAVGASLLVSVGGVVLLGRDGRMATYAALVLACAAALGWAGWGPGSRR